MLCGRLATGRDGDERRSLASSRLRSRSSVCRHLLQCMTKQGWQARATWKYMQQELCLFLHCGGWWPMSNAGRRRTLVRGLRPQAPSSVGRKGCGGQACGTPLPIGRIGLPPASDRRTVQAAPGLRTCSSAGPRVGSEVEPRRLTYAHRCGTETVPLPPKEQRESLRIF